MAIINGDGKKKNLIGTKSADTINGSSIAENIDGNLSNDVLHGGGGNDTILGGLGDDTITGDAGADSVGGGDGNDLITGGAGNDSIDGGTGIDTVTFASGVDGYTIQLTSYQGIPVLGVTGGTGEGTDFFGNVEYVRFGNTTYSTSGPVARSDNGSGTENQTITITNVLANDQSLKAGASLVVQKESGGNASDGDTVAHVDGIAVTLGPGNTLAFNTGAVYDSLAAGQSATRNFSYTVGNGTGNFASATVTLTINGVNDAPVITNSGTAEQPAFVSPENTTGVVGTVSASDVDHPAQPLTWSLGDNTDADTFRFDINPVTGELILTEPQDFESTEDGADNLMRVTVRASDGIDTTEQYVWVGVSNVNDAPVITNGGTAEQPAFVIPENTTGMVGTVVASDPDRPTQTLTWSLGSDSDADTFRFDINPATGELILTEPQDFESTEDGADNLMRVTVRVSDGTDTTEQYAWVGVSNVNEVPQFQTTGGETQATKILVPENTTGPVTTISATDDGPAPLTYSIVPWTDGNIDHTYFNINSTTGALEFITPPDFEFDDPGADDLYKLQVAATDNAGVSTTRDVWVQVTNVADNAVALQLTDIVGVSIPEGSSDAHSYPLWDQVWSVSGSPAPNNIGIGWLVNPEPSDYWPTDNFAMHDHVYISSYAPDPTRAVVTFEFAAPTNVDEITVVEHTNGVTKLHGYVGDSLDAMTTIGSIHGSLGDLNGPGQFSEGQENVFDFDNSMYGKYFQVVVDETNLENGYALYRMFPEGVILT